jgi:hypothetical protein
MFIFIFRRRLVTICHTSPSQLLHVKHPCKHKVSCCPSHTAVVTAVTSTLAAAHCTTRPTVPYAVDAFANSHLQRMLDGVEREQAGARVSPRGDPKQCLSSTFAPFPLCLCLAGRTHAPKCTRRLSAHNLVDLPFPCCSMLVAGEQSV